MRRVTGAPPVHCGSPTSPVAVQAMDVLTPLGRGQAQLIAGPPDAGKTLAAVDCILGQVPPRPPPPSPVTPTAAVCLL